MEAWCLALVFVCVVFILGGILLLYRARGPRVVSGRRGAMLAYAALFVVAVCAVLMACLNERIWPLISADSEFQPVILSILIAIAALLVSAMICLWLSALSLRRSVILYNVRRDDVVGVLQAVLRDLAIPATHRLRTFRDDFGLPGAHIVVHGAIGMSRLEWRGPQTADRARVLDLAVARLSGVLAEQGRTLTDERVAGSRSHPGSPELPVTA